MFCYVTSGNFWVDTKGYEKPAVSIFRDSYNKEVALYLSTKQLGVTF